MANIKEIYRWVSAMKTGLILLVMIGLISALGSAIIPDIFFNTIIFKGLLILLLVNLALCTFNQLIHFGTRSRGGLGRQSGLLLLHAGIVLILVGGTVFAYYGQSGEISIAKGDTIAITKVIKLQQPFSLQLNDFKIEFNQNGSPSQYYSYVTVIEEGVTRAQETISVNHPLQYRKIKAYQMSFGYLVSAKLTSAGGSEVQKFLKEGDILELTGTERVVKIYRYFPSFDPAGGMNQTSLKPDNPRVVYSVYEQGKLLGMGAAQFGEKVEIDNTVDIVFSGVKPYTVLKLKSDPGLPIALTGGLMFMFGAVLSLLSTPVRQ